MFNNYPKYNFHCLHFMNEHMPKVWTSFLSIYNVLQFYVYNVYAHGNHFKWISIFVLPWNVSGKFEHHSGANVTQTAGIPNTLAKSHEPKQTILIP